MTTPQLTITELASPVAPNAVVVLIPGLGTEVAATLPRLTSYLDPRWHVIGVDLPGHGRSPAWESAEGESMHELGLGVVQALDGHLAQHPELEGLPVRVAGSSLAGGLALQIGFDHPDRVDRVAAVCSAARIGEPETWHKRAAAVLQDGTEQLVAGNRERWFSPDFAEKHPDTVEEAMSGLREADRGSYAALCRVVETFDLRDRLPEFTVPVLAVVGGRDAVTPAEQGRQIAESVPSGTLRMIDDAAHQAAVEFPDDVAVFLRGAFND